MLQVNKKDVIKTLETIAVYMELKGENSFKVSAYRKAAQALETDDRSLADIGDPTELKGIGKGTGEVITELMETGKSSELEDLKKEVPSGLVPLLQVQGLGGKKLAKLYKELGVIDADSLKKAAGDGEIQKLSGFGKKSEEKILAALEEMGTRPERLPIAFMLAAAEKVEDSLRGMAGIEKWSRAGSLRRMRETVKDMDFIIATEKPENVRNQLLELEGIEEVIASGDTKVSLVMVFGYDVAVDFRLVQPAEFATALHHFTGSKDHNVRMRQLAKEKGEKISEYGVEVQETGEILTFESEEAFFSHFGLPFIPPEIRESGEEVDAYLEADIRLVEVGDIKGDLHMHTTWSDGAYSIEEMVEAARKRGYEYICITDHSQYLRVANGLTPERLRAQRKEIDRLNEKYNDILILSGTEMDILPNAELDFDEHMMGELDLVIASIHSSFSQDRKTIMKRLKQAVKNNHVDIIAHPTGRLIGRREGYDVDLDMLIELAAETDTALELNANPHRLDLSAEWLRKAQDAGVKLSINTDAHQIDTFDHMKIGAAAARKGWVKKETVINTWDIADLTAFLKRNDNS
ncbi:DNA polymerase/3'-5' exonuclease PolX [Bacillus marinisedimentorum]|uniref:DNA polymerase/3'-5' exonuclease PolX n=1 Tax=Bacillus marinisedimentorum TaxID=1821260 RepID=UPI000872E4E9|nr:DNA polymerase/3'-5' exonuclease PolX [Bacillus marinisedimentorum]